MLVGDSCCLRREPQPSLVHCSPSPSFDLDVSVALSPGLSLLPVTRPGWGRETWDLHQGRWHLRTCSQAPAQVRFGIVSLGYVAVPGAGGREVQPQTEESTKKSVSSLSGLTAGTFIL